nr:hypothetical protein [Actinomycetales bacterium]
MASLLARRAGSRKLLLLALVLLTAAATALVALTVAGAGVTATRASRAAIDAHLGGAPAWEVRTRIAPDPDAQDRAVRETVVETATGLTTEVGRYLLTEPTTVLADGGESRRGLLSTDAGSLLVDGRWPGTGEVLAPADLGVGIGGTVRVGDATFTVSGTWDRPEPTLSGTPAPTGDPDPLVLADDAAVLAIDDASFVFWNVRVDPTGLDLAALTDLATVGTRLDTSIRAADGVAIRGLSVADNLETGGGQLATVLQGSTTTVRAVSLAPAGFLVAVAALAIAQFLQLLALTRDAETRVLLARGAGRARIVRSAALESAAVAVVGAGAGALISLAVLSGAPGGPQQTPAVVTTAVGTLVW